MRTLVILQVASVFPVVIPSLTNAAVSSDTSTREHEARARRVWFFPYQASIPTRTRLPCSAW